jgi:phenylacetate-CoA ligase
VLSVSWDRGVVVMTNACLWRSRRWAGFEFGSPYATLFGRFVVPAAATRPPFWRVNRAWNQLMLSPLHLSDVTAPLYLDAMRDFGAEALEAYPTSAYILARYAEAAGLRLPLKSVFTTSEPLLPIQRELIEDRFCCRVFDFYSQAERVMFSSECEFHDGHHVYEEYGVTELVDGAGAPVPTGSMGRVVATSLHSFGMPLIRYALGDVTSTAARPCRCGRTPALVTGVATKEDDVVVTPDGRLLPPSILSPAFKGARAAAKSQIIQRRPDEIIIRIVRLGAFTPDDERLIEHGLRMRMGPAVRVRFEYVEDIPCSARGKFRWIVSTVPLPWGGAGRRVVPEDGA